MKGSRVKQLTAMGMLSALAYVVMLVGHVVPAVEGFLQYEPKDVIITIAGFIYGPLSAAAVSVVVALLEMVTISKSGPIGMVMNVIASWAFACTAALVYKKRRDMKGAIVGLVAGVLTMTAVMLVWNWLITPLYMKVEREVVMGMLAPVFLPFNLLKGALNAALVLLLYKPLVKILRRGNFAPERQLQQQEHSGGMRTGVMLAALVVVATCVLVVLLWQKII